MLDELDEPESLSGAGTFGAPTVTDQLRVAYVTMLFPAASETFASLDVRELTRKGAQVEVHSLRFHQKDLERLADERGITHVRRTYNSAAATAQGLMCMVRRPGETVAFISELFRRAARRPAELVKALALAPRAFSIYDALRQARPDVLHVYWGHYPALVGLLVQRNLPQTAVSMSLGAYDLTAAFPITDPVAQNALFVRTHGQCNVSELVQRVGVPRERVAVIFNGIDLNLVPPNPLAIPRIPGRIVTVGRLTPSKAVDDVIKVFAKVREKLPKVSLEIFGDGADRRRLEELASELGCGDSVIFRGHLPQAAIFEAIASAEVFLFMSRSRDERLPNVLKEAMACGTICVSTESVGIDELIVDSNYGFVIPQGDVEGASTIVTQVLENPERFVGVRGTAREYVTENFDVRKTTDNYLRRWRQAVKARG